MTYFPQLPSLTGPLETEFCAWVASQGLDDNAPAEELLYDESITADQRSWLSDFVLQWEAAEKAEDANLIAAKWLTRLGLGFHPDTPGPLYAPDLPKQQQDEYANDMHRLFDLVADPYDNCIAVAQALGLYSSTTGA